MTTATQEKTDTPRPWLKGNDGISRYANVSRRTAQSWLSNGLKARRLSARLILVRPEDVDTYIASLSDERASRRGEV